MDRGVARYHWLPVAAAAVALGAAPQAAFAQARPDSLGLFVAPHRPALAAEADTNDARAYFNLGLGLIGEHPGRAIPAFYWAARLDPVSPQTFYALHVALVLSDARRRRHYLTGDSSLPRHESRALDSLGALWRRLDPLIARGLDQFVLLATFRHAVDEVMRGRGGRGMGDAMLWSLLATTVDAADPAMGAMLAFSQGRYEDAIALWDSSTSRGWPAFIALADRARAQARLQRWDDAIQSLTLAMDSLRAFEEARTLPWRVSAAEFAYTMGRVYELSGRNAEARRAYESALEEDLSWYPAHVRIGMLAIGAGDTTTAVRELGAAIAVRDDYVARTLLGALELRRGEAAAAAEHLRAAITLEPWAAVPWLMLGAALEAGDRSGAIHAYSEFLERSPRDDAQRVRAYRRIVALRSQPSTPPAQP